MQGGEAPRTADPGGFGWSNLHVVYTRTTPDTGPKDIAEGNAAMGLPEAATMGADVPVVQIRFDHPRGRTIAGWCRRNGVLWTVEDAQGRVRDGTTGMLRDLRAEGIER